MANELIYLGDVSEIGLTISAKIFNPSGVQVGTDISLSDTNNTGIYTASISGLSAGTFIVRYYSSSVMVGQSTIVWDGVHDATTSPSVRQELSTELARIDANISSISGGSLTAEAIRTELDTNSTKLANLDATVSSRLAASSYTSPPSAASIRTELDTNSTKLANLDATVGSRLASASYTAPDNTSIGAIKAKTDNLPLDPADNSDILSAISSIDIPSVLEVSSGVRSELATELGRIDTTISSRSTFNGGAVASVTAPVTVGTNNDKSGYTISGTKTSLDSLNDITTTQIRTALSTELARIDANISSRSIAGDAMTLTSGERVAIANEVENQIINDTDTEKVLQAIVDKIASANPSLEDLTLASIASAVRTELTTELARIDVAISSRLASIAYSSAPSVSAIRTELDTNSTKLANLDASVSSRLSASSYVTPDNTSIAAIKAKTDNLPLDPADNSQILSAIDGVGGGSYPSTTDIATAIRSELTTELGRIDATISSRLPTASYSAPPSAASIRTELDTNSTKLARLDATVSSRSTFNGGAVASVTSPVTVGTNNDKSGYTISGTISTLDSLNTQQNTKHSQTQSLISGLHNISTADIRTELTTELSRIDTTISSRLPTASYIIPDNTKISLIYGEVQTHPTLSEIEQSTILAKASDVSVTVSGGFLEQDRQNLLQTKTHAQNAFAIGASK